MIIKIQIFIQQSAALPDNVTTIAVCWQAEVFVAGSVLTQFFYILFCIVIIVLSFNSSISSHYHHKIKKEKEDEKKERVFLLLSFLLLFAFNRLPFLSLLYSYKLTNDKRRVRSSDFNLFQALFHFMRVSCLNFTLRRKTSDLKDEREQKENANVFTRSSRFLSDVIESIWRILTILQNLTTFILAWWKKSNLSDPSAS